MESGHASLRYGRCSIPGQVYFVTFATHGRRPHFSEWSVAATAATLLASSTSWPDASVLAWVLMPDHWHGLVRLEGHSISSVVGHCKGRTSRLLRAQDPGLGRIWATGFHDRALRREEDLRTAARYIVMNPVRAGLARRPGDYPFWDAAWL